MSNSTPTGQLYVFAQSRDRVAKERSMRLRQLRGLLHRLKELHAMKLSAKDLLLKLGEARERYRAAWRLLGFELPSLRGKKRAAAFSFRLNREKLRNARRREGRYLLRTNLCDQDPAKLWNLYIQLTEIEAAFKNSASNSPSSRHQKSPPMAPFSHDITPRSVVKTF
ncbi:MAG: hypothetical protein WC076_12845 [Terrimicrobiaceae bacterium]